MARKPVIEQIKMLCLSNKTELKSSIQNLRIVFIHDLFVSRDDPLMS